MSYLDRPSYLRLLASISDQTARQILMKFDDIVFKEICPTYMSFEKICPLTVVLC
jgi:hypothetical protein